MDHSETPTPPSAPDNGRLALLNMFLAGRIPDDPKDRMAFLGLINRTLQQAEAEVELISALRDLEMLRLADNKIAVVERIGDRCGKTKGWVSQHTAAARVGVPRATIERVLADQAARAKKYATDPRTPAVARVVARSRAHAFNTAIHRWMERFGTQRGAAALLPVAAVPGIREWFAAKAAALTGTGGGAASAGGVAAGTSAGGVAAVAVVPAAQGAGVMATVINVVAATTGTSATVAATTAAGVGLVLTGPALADVVTPDTPPAITETPAPATSSDSSPSPTNDSPTTAGVGPTFAATAPTPTAAGSATVPLPKTSSTTQTAPLPRNTRQAPPPTAAPAEPAPAPTPAATQSPASEPSIVASAPAADPQPVAPAETQACAPAAGGMPIPALEPTAVPDSTVAPEPSTAPESAAQPLPETSCAPPEPSTAPTTEAPTAPSEEPTPSDAPLPASSAEPASVDTSGGNSLEVSDATMFRISAWEPSRRDTKRVREYRETYRRPVIVPYARGHQPSSELRTLIYAAH
uniref:hypothetical protein n=1 Tax=Streptosporangium sp. CA-235898 TaxID=3240073 RepID=UPI003F497044